jgi:branched-subunit amino acid aminotransferase/4-amino-4-deoxychorismate lyase
VILADGTIETAPTEFVLEGTVRKSVLALCNEHKLPIKFALPHLEDFPTWQGAFLTSKNRIFLFLFECWREGKKKIAVFFAGTSRLILPIYEMRFPEHKDLKERTFPPCPIIQKLQNLLNEELLSKSTQVIQ